MVKLFGMQGLLMAGDQESQDHDPPTPRSHSQSESYTGWPWTERHDYGQLRPESTSTISTSSRAVSGEQEEESLLGIGRMGPGAIGTQHRMQKAIGLVIFLNVIVVLLEGFFTSHQVVHVFFRFLELAFTVVFMVLLVRALKTEVVSLTEALAAKQATALAECNEETLRTFRAEFAGVRDSFNEKRTSVEKDLRARLTKAEAAVAAANAETAAVLRELQEVLVVAKSAQHTADEVNERVTHLKTELLERPRELCMPHVTNPLQVAELQDTAVANLNLMPYTQLEEGLLTKPAKSFLGSEGMAVTEEATPEKALDEHWVEAFAAKELVKAVESAEYDIAAGKDQTSLPVIGDLDSTGSTAVVMLPEVSKDMQFNHDSNGMVVSAWAETLSKPDEDGI